MYGRICRGPALCLLIMPFGQSFQVSDLGVVVFLIILEGLLSADNALVLAIMVRHLPRELRHKALLYGLGGAFVFRGIAIVLASKIIAFWWLQAIGALYLLYLPAKHFWMRARAKEIKPVQGGFWRTVIAVEIADIAFAIDSVLAAVAVVKGADKLWVVYTGAIVGVILLRFAAGFFIRILERYPALDHVAYVIVGWVGVKLAFMAIHNFTVYWDSTHTDKVPFHVPEMPAAVFWSVLALIAVLGTLHAVRTVEKDAAEQPGATESASETEEPEPAK